jgi:hypothetical protein
MAEGKRVDAIRSNRLLIAGLVGAIIFLGLILAALAGGRATLNTELIDEPVNVLANSDDDCVECHSRTTPGIVDQYGQSTMAVADVSCRDCHEVDSDYPSAIEHQDTYVSSRPTSAICGECHAAEVAQFNQSRHALPAYVAYAGTEPLNDDLLAQYGAIPEGNFSPDRARNALHAMEGEAITRFACESCHDVGKPAPDNSVGQCDSCHLRHEFSLEQVRKPETCNACHIGPDHPQWEIYQESAHGIAYATGSDDWHWSAEPGTLDTTDFPAPTCATCHISGFGASGTTHDVGDRLTWYLFSPVSERRPAWQDNAVRMQAVCSECHSETYIEDFYQAADAATEQINAWVIESNEIIAPLEENGLLTDEPFDQPIDYEYFELWHHWGRTAKFGVWMQGADYVQWHGAYEVLRSRAHLIEMTEDMLKDAGIELQGDE